MEDRTLDHLRSLAITVLVAVLAGVVVVLTPLLVGAARAQRTDTDVVNLRAYPDIDDQLLQKQLKDTDGSSVLLLIPPPGSYAGQPFDCTNRRLPRSCPIIHEHERRVVLDGDTGDTLNTIYGQDTADADGTTYVRPLHGTFAWGAATKVGLVMAIVVAAAFFFVLRAGPRKLRSVAPDSGPAGARPAPATGPPPVQHMSAAPVHRGAAAPPPSPRKPSPPRPEPLPADAIPPAGHRVVARTHFGPGGGYVDAGGVVLWASLAEPADGAYPGQELTVVGPDRGKNGLVVSHHVIEEVRP
ncbi:hypothetical protein ACQPZX_32870 [Actinoplanes sp. CA-142083]|uniref:hypothetical protein n=1 Tax=Actinoplanes sp. CA-142083 TaxID=3239903 RepID=UPI003D89B8EE